MVGWRSLGELVVELVFCWVRRWVGALRHGWVDGWWVMVDGSQMKLAGTSRDRVCNLAVADQARTQQLPDWFQVAHPLWGLSP